MAISATMGTVLIPLQYFPVDSLEQAAVRSRTCRKDNCVSHVTSVIKNTIHVQFWYFLYV